MRRTSFLLLMFALFLTAFRAQAQAPIIVWPTSPPSPSLSASVIAVQGEEITLSVIFTTTGALSNGFVRLTLPDGISATSIASVTGGSATLPGTPATGTVNIPVTIATVGANVEIPIRLRATNCTATGQKNITVAVLSGETPLMDMQGSSGSRTIAIDVRVPIIATTSTSGNSGELQSLSESYTFETYLTVSNGVRAPSVKIELTKDQFTTLSEISFGGQAVLAGNIAETATKVTLTFASLSTPISSAYQPKLSFKAQARVFGEHPVKLAAIYPAAGNCANYADLFTATLRYKTTSGNASLRYAEYTYLTNAYDDPLRDTLTLLPTIAFDGTTTNYFRVRLQNTGTVAIRQFNFQVNAFASNYGGGATYIKTGEPVLYRIKDIPGFKTVSNKNYTIPWALPHTNIQVLPQYLGTPRRVDILFEDSIPAGKDFFIYVPIATGNIFDNSNWDWISGRTASWSWYGRMDCGMQTSFDYNGNNVVYDPSPGSFFSSNLSPEPSRCDGDANELLINENATATTSLPINFIGHSTEFRDSVYIEIPKWLTINAISDIKIAGTSITGTLMLDATGANNIYSFATGKNGGTLTITYHAAPKNSSFYNSSGDIETGTIRYWINWDLGANVSPDIKQYRPVLKHVAKMTQSVSCIKGESGIKMTSLALKRDSRGWEVQTGSNAKLNTPVSPATWASDAAINHHAYLQGDSGRIIINTKALDNNCNYLYVLLESPFIYRTTLDATRVSIINPTTSAPISTDTKAFVGDISTGKIALQVKLAAPLAKDSETTITIPFKLASNVPGSSNLTYSDVKVSVYLSPGVETAPFNPVNRQGSDILLEQMRVHLVNFATEMHLIDNTIEREISGRGRLVLNYPLSYTIWNFSNEYRPTLVLNDIRITANKGLIVDSLVLIKDRVTDESSAINDFIQLKHSGDSIVNADGTVTYIYDVFSRFVHGKDYNPAIHTTGDPGTNVWIYPNQDWRYYIGIIARPTNELPLRTNIRTYYRYRASHNDFTSIFDGVGNGNNPLTYKGVAGSLSISGSNEILSYGKNVTIPSINVSISSSDEGAQYPVWLFVAGDIENLSLKKNSVSLTDINAVTGGYWVSLGSLTANEISNYQLQCDLNNQSKSGVPITLHLISGFGDAGFTPNTSLELSAITNPADPDYIGETRIGMKTAATVKASANCAIQGSMTVTSDKIRFNTEYTVNVDMDSETSDSDILNPTATITAPAGQRLTSVSYYYPADDATKQTLSGAYLTTLQNAFLETGSASIEAAKLLGETTLIFPGRRSGTVAPKSIKLELGFTPDCNTGLNGISYRYAFSARDFLNQTTVGVPEKLSDPVWAALTYNYKFTPSIALANNNPSFGGNLLSNVLQITLTKSFDPNQEPVNAFDYIDVSLPRWLEADLPKISVASSDAGLTGLLTDMGINVTNVTDGAAVAANKLVLRINLPVGFLNSRSDKGAQLPFTYNIPVNYRATPESVLRNTPEQQITAGIYTLTNFDVSCDNAPFLLGDDSKNIALLTLKTPNPYLYNMASIGKPFEVQVTSKDFTGGWYANEALTSSLSPNATYTHPSRQTADTVMVYVKVDFTQSYGKIPVTFRTPPASLTWRTNVVDSVWLNPANWTSGNAGDDGMKYLPALITTVTLPSGAKQYPILKDTVACRIIRFEHGAELGRQDLLVYDSARVQLKITANQWYMFSPPLHQMYSGDFYREDPDPYVDKQTAYTVRFNITNPETFQAGTSAVEWTGAFNTPNIELGAGSGLAVWIDNGKEIDVHDPLTFEFPKHDAKHHLYNPDRFPPGNISATYPIERDKNGHFIYEGKVDVDGNVKLPVSSVDGKDGSVLIGNPFMSHLNFTEFYKANSDALSSDQEYKLVHGAGTNLTSFVSYKWNELQNKYISTDAGDAGEGLIAPMQSFVVQVVGSTQSLKTNIHDHTKTSTSSGNAFRAAIPNISPLSRQLDIQAVRNTETSKVIVLQDSSYATHYLPSEDSYKLFVSKVYDSDDVLKHIQLYTRSSDGYALDINCIGTSEQDITIPLCIRTSEKGEIVLNFSGMESFGEETGIYLYDAQHPERLIDLSSQPEYVFDKTEDALYLENRLSLVIGALKQPLGIREVSNTSTARIFSQPHRTLRIVSENGEALSDIRITDSWGRTLLNIPAVSSSTYEYQTPTPGIYIVHVGAEVKKVISIQ
jgi:hypothetical protein